MEKKTVAAKKEKAVKPKISEKTSAMTLDILDMSGKTIGKIELAKEVFGVKPNKSLIAQAVRVYLANQRFGGASTKTRAEVRGGGAKPWKQKGTGRARAGSIRSPHWRGGGVTFGPKPRDYSLEMPKKMKKSALISALSDKFINKGISVINEINFKEAKTKEAATLIKSLDFAGKNMIVFGDLTEKESRAFKNIKDTRAFRATDLNTYEVLNYKKILITKSGIEKITESLLGK